MSPPQNTAGLTLMTIVGPDGVTRKEKPVQARAFSLWVNMGGGGKTNTIATIAKHTRIESTPRTIWRWYTNLRWQDRLAQRNDDSLSPEGVEIAVVAKAEKKLEELPRLDEDIVLAEGDSLAKMLRLIDSSIAEYETKLAAGKIIINSPKDLEILAKLRGVLTGGPGEDKPLNINIITGIPRPTGHPIHPTIIDMEPDEGEE